MIKVRSLRTIAAILLSSLVLVVACQRAGTLREETETALTRIRREGRVRVGFANEAPFAYLDPETGELTGEAPTVAREILSRIGVAEIEPVLTEFGSLIPGLQAGRFDLIAAGMYITPKRCQQIAFSNPTYSLGEAFLVLQGNPLGLHSYADVASSEEAQLGVVAGTVEIGYAEKIGIPKERLMIFPDMPSAAAGIEAGRADAFAGTSLTVKDLLSKSKSGKLERAAPFSDPVIDGKTVRGYGAFGFGKEDEGLIAAFNKHLADYIGTDGHADAVARFGFGPAEAPGLVTATALCSASVTP